LNRLLALPFIAMLAFSSTAGADSERILVVVNQTNTTDSMTRSEVIDIFMGRYNAFPSGEAAVPIELKGDGETKEIFYKQLVGMSLSRINTYWSRLRFSGRKRGSVQFQSQNELVDYVTSDPSAISYIAPSELRDGMKVVYVIE